MATSQPVPRFKVILLGDSGVGKTALFQQFVDSTFPANSISTTGVDCVVKDMQFRGRKLKLHLWVSGATYSSQVSTLTHCHCYFLGHGRAREIPIDCAFSLQGSQSSNPWYAS